MNKHWDERYSKHEYHYGTEPNTFLLENISALPKGTNVLCLAEGEGRNAVFLAKCGYDVTAVDFSSVGLKKLEALAESRGVVVKTVCADLRGFVFEKNYWGAIVSIWCHLPSALRTEVHRRAVEGLKPGGVFLLEAYRPQQLEFKTGGPPDTDLMPTLAQLDSDFSNLKPILRQEINRNVSEGIGHSGMSAVVQYLAVKE